MRLSERCRNNFSNLVRVRGDEYLRSGAVKIVVAQPTEIQAEVVGGAATPYRVTIRWQEGKAASLDAACTCPHFSGGELCKHVWATLVAAGRHAGVHGPQGNKSLQVKHNYEILEDADAVRQSLKQAIAAQTVAPPPEPPAARRRPGISSELRDRLGGPAVARQRTDWEQRMTKVANRVLESLPDDHAITGAKRPLADAWFGIDVEGTRAAQTLVLQLLFRERKLNGQLGGLKRLARRRREDLQFEDPEDNLLVDILLGAKQSQIARVDLRINPWNLPSSQSSCVGLPPALYASVLPRLAATGRLLRLDDSLDLPNIDVAPRIAWEAGPPWRPDIRVAHDPAKGRWRLTQDVVREGERRPLDRDTIVVDDGLAIFADRLGLADWGRELPLVKELCDSPEIAAPEEELNKFLSAIYIFPLSESISVPAEVAWRPVHRDVVGHLTIQRRGGWKGDNALLASVRFAYGEDLVDQDATFASFVDPRQRLYLRRDFAAEKALLRQLHKSGFRSQSYAWARKDKFNWALANPNKLPSAVASLAAAGWTIQTEGKFIRQAGNVAVSVTTGIDWFDLSGKVTYGQEEVSLPAVLAALRKGEQYVALSDGSQGVLPREWLQKFGALAGLGQATATGDGSIRFKASQAMLLDALLAEQEHAQVDPGFSRVREKWRGFGGIQPAAPPAGFRGELRPYQQEGLGWLRFLDEFQLGGCLADDMGLGKTIQVLAFLAGRRAAADARRPSLIVVPKSLVFNWQEEAARFTPELQVLNYTGAGRRDLRDHLHGCDLLLTTYGTLRKDITKLKEIEFDYAILDEAQAIKNATSLSAKACRLINARRRLVLTGTPVENRLSDLWSLFEFLNPGMLGQSATFQEMVRSSDPGLRRPDAMELSPDLDDDDAEASDVREVAEVASRLGDDGSAAGRSLLGRALRPLILRRTKQQVLTELPARFEQTLHCEMEPTQRKIYDELRNYYRNGLTQRVREQGWAKAKIHVLEALLRLRQAACHPGLIDPKHATAPSAKLTALFERIDELIAEGHKALVFSQFTSLLDLVRKKLDRAQITYEYLDGQTNDRQTRVHRFQNDADCPLFLLSLKAGGQGLNLTAADYVFILDPWWNPAVEAQAIDRAYRLGQTRNVFAYRLICSNTVEEKIVELQQSKRALADAIISEDNRLLAGMTPEDLQLLLS